MAEKRIIEINGAKFEVDLSKAKCIEEFRIGDKVKVLQKQYDVYKGYPGVVIGFEPFKNRPSIVIAYLVTGYKECDVKFLYFNSSVEDVEICHTQVNDVPISRSNIVTKFNEEIRVKEQEANELRAKLEYFESAFGKYFEEVYVDPELAAVDSDS